MSIDLIYNNQKIWGFVELYLSDLETVTSIPEFVKIYQKYHSIFRQSRRVKTPSCQALLSLSADFEYKLCGPTLTYIRNLVKQAKTILPTSGSLPILCSYSNPTIRLTQLQCATLLAMMFLGVFPERFSTDRQVQGQTITQNFHCDDLFSNAARQCPEKIKCLIAYFSVLSSRSVEQAGNDIAQEITWTHHRIADFWDDENWRSTHLEAPKWESLQQPLQVNKFLRFAGPFQGIDEFQTNAVCADFASSHGTGGGVLRSGCVQEEIKFVTHPELICSLLFCQTLGKNDVILVQSYSKYAEHTGYSSQFKFKKETYHSGTNGKFNLVMMNAVNVKKSPNSQYSRDMILRDINKAYLAAKCVSQWPFITGNWGCGAYGNDIYLKFLVQVVAMATAERRVMYCCYNETEVLKELKELALKIDGMKVGQLVKILLSKPKGKQFKAYLQGALK